MALAGLGAAANPLLRPFATAVTYTVERWADEQAARATSNRRRVARADSKAALAARRHPRPRLSTLASAASSADGSRWPARARSPAGSPPS